MKWLSKHERHAMLVSRMADTVGIDLDEKEQRGKLAPEALDGAVFRCMGCDDPAGCAKWLEAHGSGAAAPPRYCRNIEFFEALK